MQNIAKEKNLSETAFTVKKENEYELRWFTPGGEIDLSVILSVCLALCGLFLLTAESGITADKGALLCLMGAFFYAIYILVLDKIDFFIGACIFYYPFLHFSA